MPENAIHVGYSLDKIGVSGEDIHRWIDEFARLKREGSHRNYRHNLDDIKIPKEFLEKYGEELARKIIENHIELDNLSNNDYSKYIEEQDIKIYQLREEDRKHFREWYHPQSRDKIYPE